MRSLLFHGIAVFGGFLLLAIGMYTNPYVDAYTISGIVLFSLGLGNWDASVFASFVSDRDMHRNNRNIRWIITIIILGVIIFGYGLHWAHLPLAITAHTLVYYPLRWHYSGFPFYYNSATTDPIMDLDPNQVAYMEDDAIDELMDKYDKSMRQTFIIISIGKLFIIGLFIFIIL